MLSFIKYYFKYYFVFELHANIVQNLTYASIFQENVNGADALNFLYF
jgi:hypothetical protein